jgi:capsule polysaccharide export protein KpsE/RkpR
VAQDLREIEVAPAENGAVAESVPIPVQDSFVWAWLLWEKRHFLARVTARGVIVALVIVLLIPNRYESTVRLMPPDQGNGGLAMLAGMLGKSGLGSAMAGGLGGMAGDLFGIKSSGPIFTEIVHSRSVQDRMIDKFDLRKVYGQKYYEDARKTLGNNTDVNEDRKSGVITITVTDKDKRRAQHMAQAYVDELDRMVALVSTSAARRERIFLEQRLQQVKQDLDVAAKQFADYSSQNTVLDVNSQTKAMVESGAVLQGQLIAAESELQGLEQIYAPSNVRVRSLKARVEELKTQLQKMGGTQADLNPATPPPSSSSSVDPSDQIYPSIRKLPLLGVRWTELYRDAKIQETVFELLTQEYEIAKIQEAKEIPTVKVLDPADLAERKSSPHRALLVLLAMVLTFTGAIVWVLGSAAWQHIDPQDSRKQFGEEVRSRVALVYSRWTGRIPGIARARVWWKSRRSNSEN